MTGDPVLESWRAQAARELGDALPILAEPDPAELPRLATAASRRAAWSVTAAEALGAWPRRSPRPGWRIAAALTDGTAPTLAARARAAAGWGAELLWVRLDPRLDPRGAGSASGAAGRWTGLDDLASLRAALEVTRPDPGAEAPGLVFELGMPTPDRRELASALAQALTGRLEAALFDPWSALLAGRPLGDEAVGAEAWQAASGALGIALDRTRELTARGVDVVGVSDLGLHERGARPQTELAWVLACWFAGARAAQAHGLEPLELLGRTRLALTVSPRLAESAAKLRAARVLWARLVELCGGDPAALPAPIAARGSLRARNRRDPWTDLLRGTLEAAGAALGGADEIQALPLDAAHDRSSGFGLRMAVNVQVMLQHESGLGALLDPAGGAAAIEVTTASLCEAAWGLWAEIEGAGGLERWASAHLAARLRADHEHTSRGPTGGARPIVGVNVHVSDRAEPLPPPDPELDELGPAPARADLIDVALLDVAAPGSP